ncbi:ABC transporter permease subunit [Lachnospiraceae bacterium ZAX-1]
MSFQLEGFIACLQSGLHYLPNTLLLTIIPVIVSLVLGTLIALARIFKVPVLSQFFAIFVTIYNGIPYVVALLIYNLLFMLKFNDVAAALGLKVTIATVPTIYIGYFALSLACTCSITESIRGAFLSIDKGQYEAGYSVGLKTRQIVVRIIIPQVVPVAIPVLLNNIIGTLKGTSVVMTVGIMDLLNGALLPCQTTYSFLVGYVAAAILYWILTIIIQTLAKLLHTRLNRHASVLAT